MKSTKKTVEKTQLRISPAAQGRILAAFIDHAIEKNIKPEGMAATIRALRAYILDPDFTPFKPKLDVEYNAWEYFSRLIDRAAERSSRARERARIRKMKALQYSTESIAGHERHAMNHLKSQEPEEEEYSAAERERDEKIARSVRERNRLLGYPWAK